MRSRKTKYSSGMSIVEVLIAIGIFSFSLLASLSFFSQANSTIKQQNDSDARRRLFQNLIYMIGMPSTIRGSLENDTSAGSLWKSVRNSLGAVPAAPLPVALFLPVVAGTATSVNTSGPITGTPTAPMFYGLDGSTCTSSCDPTIYTISVSTEFMPICPPDYDYYRGVWVGPVNPNGLNISNTCNRAQYLKVFYNFQPAPGSPVELSFTPVTGSVMVSAVLANVEI